MSHLLIHRYLNELQDLRKVSGTSRESVVREAFKDLLKGWARSLEKLEALLCRMLRPQKPGPKKKDEEE